MTSSELYMCCEVDDHRKVITSKPQRKQARPQIYIYIFPQTVFKFTSSSKVNVVYM